ncbi:MAG: hypothetical protein LBS12_04420, partial [Prevotellaceae bacterium]|nr:hypothetical protein [Prevotellaceae bacterium]
MPDSGSVTVCVRMLTANGCADSICTTISAGTVTPPTPILAGAGTYCDNTVLNSYGVAGYSYQLQNILL